MTDDAKRNAENYLDTCALGYAAAVNLASDPPTDLDLEAHRGARAALHDAGVQLAAALGNLDAAERAELEALRRFRDGVVAMRGEIAAGKTDTGEPVTRALVVQTIGALLLPATLGHAPTKETPCPGS